MRIYFIHDRPRYDGTARREALLLTQDRSKPRNLLQDCTLGIFLRIWNNSTTSSIAFERGAYRRPPERLAISPSRTKRQRTGYVSCDNRQPARLAPHSPTAPRIAVCRKHQRLRQRIANAGNGLAVKIRTTHNSGPNRTGCTAENSFPVFAVASRTTYIMTSALRHSVAYAETDQKPFILRTVLRTEDSVAAIPKKRRPRSRSASVAPFAKRSKSTAFGAGNEDCIVRPPPKFPGKRRP